MLVKVKGKVSRICNGFVFYIFFVSRLDFFAEKSIVFPLNKKIYNG